MLVLANDRAPAIDHCFLLAAKHLTRHRDGLIVGFVPSDGLFQPSQLVERYRGMRSTRGAVVPVLAQPQTVLPKPPLEEQRGTK
jgi:hypothetical protein